MLRPGFVSRWTVVGVASLGICLGTDRAGSAQNLEDAMVRDLWQTVQARKALFDDPQLGPLNLGVVVKNRTATLWGPVPSPELSFRAEQRLRAMIELFEIRNRLTIEPDDDAKLPPAGTPETPRALPDPTPPVAVPAPRPPAIKPSRDVSLAGIVTPTETLIAHSSPLEGESTGTALPASATVRVPFLGSLPWPR
jgi:hypothetical protein